MFSTVGSRLRFRCRPFATQPASAASASRTRAALRHHSGDSGSPVVARLDLPIVPVGDQALATEDPQKGDEAVLVRPILVAVADEYLRRVQHDPPLYRARLENLQRIVEDRTYSGTAGPLRAIVILLQW